ncbi:MAG TPA: alanine racemase [Acidimicrobiales bacterium]|nr:alanine racemase [Acidimicrobiales bacterium]
MAGSPGRVQAQAPPTDVVVARVAALRRRIEEAGRDPAGVRIVAVTKGFTTSAVDAARRAGLYDIGENYADELLAKVADATSNGDNGPPVHAGHDGGAGDDAPVTRWHYLGAVQRRRVRALAPVVSYWQTVSRAVEGETIATHAPGATVFVEIDATDVPGRNGCRPSEVPGLVTSLRGAGLDVRGLMTVGPPGTPEESRGVFRLTAALAQDLGLPEVSMGMTDDLEVALSEGSTMVRVGRALFGERPLQPA